MPRRKTSPFYASQVATLAEEGCNPAQIFRVIEERAEKAERKDWPSERTVRRLYEEHQKLPNERVRREQALFLWPESMEAGLLPWEASSAALDFVRYCAENRLERPTVRHCKWFWYLRLAAPTMPIERAVTTSCYLWAREYLRQTKMNEDVDVPGIMWTLAYQPWRGEQDKSALDAVAEQLRFDPSGLGLSSPDFAGDEYRALALGSLNPGFVGMLEQLSRESSLKTETEGKDNG